MAYRILFILIALIAFLGQGWGIIPTAIAQDSPAVRLSIIIAPTVLPADETVHSAAYVQLQGADGIPVLASQNTEISLSSSNRAVVNAPAVVNILAGRSYVSVPLTTTSVPGSATITAIAPELTPVTATLETFSPLGAELPLRLALYASPLKMLPGSQPPGRLSVVLMGSNGRLAPASKIIDIVLTSSNPSVVRPVGQITIPKGSTFTTVDLRPVAVGIATISAASSGFISDLTQVQVVNPGQSADALILHQSPPILPSGTGRHPGIVVQAVDAAGVPVYFPCTQVFLTSSSPESVEIVSEPSSVCDQKVQYVEGLLDVGDLPGTATFSAQATGLRPGSAGLEIQGRVPFKLIAILAPAKPMAAEVTPGVIIVQVQDASGAPVRLHGGIPVKLIGGGDVLQEELTIPHGRSYASIEIQGAQSIQQIDLSLVSPGLTSARLSGTLQLLPLTAEVVVSSAGPLFPGEQSDIRVLVQSMGKPVPQAKLTWSATGGTLGFIDTAQETAENGEGRVVLIAQAPGDVLVNVTVSKAGYQQTEAQVTVNVVASQETDTSSPGLFGIPILLLFLLLSAVLFGYLGYRYWPIIKTRLNVGSSHNSVDDGN